MKLNFQCAFLGLIVFSKLSFCQKIIPNTSSQVKDTSITIYFATAVYKLDSSQINNILNFTHSIKGVKDIIGYADTVGTINYNRNLSKLRAQNVYQIVSSRVKCEGNYSYKGEQFPQDPDLSLNRKVEITGYKLINNSTAQLYTNDEVIDSFYLEEINFLPDQAIITSGSIGTIPTLVSKIKSYKGVRFQIIGHANYQSKNDSSFIQDIFKLSEERAKLIYQVLIENGIPKNILKYKGVGNSQPLIKYPINDEERMKNMRVQILVIKS